MKDKRWSVRKVSNNQWAIFDSSGSWHDTVDDHADAMDWAYWYALSQALSEPGALAAFRELIDKADWWDAYLKAIDTNIARATSRAKAVIT